MFKKGEGKRERKEDWGRERNIPLLGSKSIYYYNSADWKKVAQSLQCATDQRRVCFEISGKILQWSDP